MMLSELSKSIARSVEVFPLFIYCNRDVEDKDMEYFIGALYDDKEYNHKYMVMTMMLMPVIMMMDIIFLWPKRRHLGQNRVVHSIQLASA